jgi:Fur family transcriptional regulator, ferric uptake regulator
VSESWIVRAESALAARGHKRGGARRAVLELLAAEPCVLSAEQMERALRARGRRGASRATVYRVLDELEALGLVQRVDTGDAAAGWERAGAGGGHHHHLVCSSCGQVEPFSDRGLEEAIERLSARVPLSVSEHEIVLRGACGRCAAAPTGS